MVISKLMGLARLVLLLVALIASQSAAAQTVNNTLVNAGEPSVSAGFVERHGVIATIPMRHANRGILKVAVATPNLRMGAETPVFGMRFGESSSESILVWCGKGQMRANLLGWGDHTVCFVETPDGKATLAQGMYFVGNSPSWYVTTLNFLNNDLRIDRVRVEPDTQPGPMLEMLVNVGKIEDNRVTLYRQLRGPAERGGRNDIYLGDWVVDLTTPQTLQGQMAAVEVSLATTKSIAVRLVRASVPTAAQPPTTMPPSHTSAGNTTSGIQARAKPTDFVIQGLFLYPDRMQAELGVIASRGVLTRGPARLWQTAALPAETVLGGFGRRVSAFDGLVLQKVENFKIAAAGLREREEFWCGVFKMRVFGSDLPAETCIFNYKDGGARIESPDPRSNLPGQNQLIDATRFVGPQFQDAPVPITVNSTVPVDDFVAEIKLIASNRRNVSISIVGTRRNISEGIFYIDLPWASDGTARLPFWTHSLVLTHQLPAGGATAKWLPDNPGVGPVEFSVLQEE